MSKPIAQITFFVLISLVLIAATSFGVHNWLGGTGNVAGAQSYVSGGLQSNRKNDAFTQPAVHQDGGCHSDASVSADDY